MDGTHLSYDIVIVGHLVNSIRVFRDNDWHFLTDTKSCQAIWLEIMFNNNLFSVWISWTCLLAGRTLQYSMLHVSHPPGGVLVNINILSK